MVIDGLCRGYHAELWFPPVLPQDRKAHPMDDYYRVAKMVCEHCPAKDECLEQGKRVDEETLFHYGARSGVWGGQTPYERESGEYNAPPRQLDPADIPKVIPLHTDTRLDIAEVQRNLRSHSWWRP